MFKSKDKAIKQLQETLGEMGFDGDVTSTEAREFWETNKGKLPQKYFEKYGDNAIDFIGNNFTTLGQKTSTASDDKKTVEKNNASAVKLTPKATKKEKTDNDFTLDEVLKVNNNDPTKVREWIRNHPNYEVGSKTQSWLDANPIKSENKEINDEDSNKKSLTDLKNNTVDTQYGDALSDAEFITNVADTQKKDESDYDEMNKIVEKFNEKSSNIDDYYKDNLPKTLWNMYKDGDLDGNTGDKEKDKKEAKKRLGYFILNGLGTGLINSSLVARGSAPSAESDLQKIRREKLEGGLERYNKKRDETMSTTLKQFGLNSELLNKFNMDVDTLKNNKIFEEVSKSLDRKGMERTLKAYTLAGKYLEGLSDDQKSNVFMAIMALNSTDGKSAGISYLVSTLGKPFADNILKIFGD